MITGSWFGDFQQDPAPKNECVLECCSLVHR